MNVRQCKFYDLESDSIYGGILIDDGLICGCCGGFIPKDEFRDTIKILSEWDIWTNLSDSIMEGE